MPTLEIFGSHGSGKTTLARTLRDGGTSLRFRDEGETVRAPEVPPVERYECTDSVVDLSRALMALGYQPVILGQRVIVRLPDLPREG